MFGWLGFGGKGSSWIGKQLLELTRESIASVVGDGVKKVVLNEIEIREKVTKFRPKMQHMILSLEDQEASKSLWAHYLAINEGSKEGKLNEDRFMILLCEILESSLNEEEQRELLTMMGHASPEELAAMLDQLEQNGAAQFYRRVKLKLGKWWEDAKVSERSKKAWSETKKLATESGKAVRESNQSMRDSQATKRLTDTNNRLRAEIADGNIKFPKKGWRKKWTSLY